MSKRHHKHRDNTGHADRVAKYHAIVADLSTQSGLPKDDLRVVDAAWARLAAENMRQQILAGVPIDIGDLERAAAVLTSVLPIKPTELVVSFVDNDLSEGERDELRTLRARVASLAQPVGPSTTSPDDIDSADPATAPAADSSKAQPSNVTSIRKSKRPDYAVAVDIATGKPRENPLAGMSVAESCAELNRPINADRGPPTGWSDL